ncbi:MAG TPA: glucosamine-6-phosphate deaminase [Bacteroidales bacterium]|nr:glucosamine-6-phosphate deaminase [Bacteroidales bacterium]
MLELSYYKDNLKVEIFSVTSEMGVAAADYVAGKLQEAIEVRGVANLILGTGASQYPLHDELLKKDIAWKKINLFHLDEYIGICKSHPASFRRFLRERVADKVFPKSVFYIDGDTADTVSEIRRYEALLRSNPVDVACIGIGENGHIAFNDPGIADFDDPELLKVVELDDACRRQQVGEGWFPTINDVPDKAITLTVSAIMNCRSICCTVPDSRKSDAVFKTLTGKISDECPASVLRRHEDAVLFLDRFAAARLSYNH